MFELAAAMPAAWSPPPPGRLTMISAAIFLAIALIYFRRALSPVGPLLRALAAATVAAVAICVALILIIASAIQGI